MKNNMLRKGLVLAIMVLFVGASVIPSISGNVRESSTISDIDVIENSEERKTLFDDLPDEEWNKTFRGTYYDIDQSVQQIIDEGHVMGDWSEEQKLTASDGAPHDNFGNSVSIDGDYVIIGALYDDDSGSSFGSAYIFKRDGTSWFEEAKLTAGDRFGMSVSIDGDYAVIGADCDDDNGDSSGSAYVFKRSGSTWTQQAKLLASDGAEHDYFGMSVSIDGEYALIGAIYADGNEVNSGSAYIFKRDGTTWAEEQKLTASDGAKGDWFGCSASISGDYAVIGAISDDDNGEDSGSAYVFKRSGTTWTQQAKLLASDGAAGDFFGNSVSIDGDHVIIGACHDDDNGPTSGSAYVFKRDGTSWTEEAKLTASDGAEGDWFGISVSIDGDHTIVGAWKDDDSGSNSGSAYIFKRDGTSWSQEAKLIASDGADGDTFGYSVSIDGDYAIIGARYDDDNGENSGSAYVFESVSPETQRLRDALDHLKDTTTFSIKFGTTDIARVQAYVYKGLYDDINFFPQVIEDLLSAIETLEFLKDLLEMNPANLFKTLIGWAGLYTLESWSDDDKREFGRCLKHILDDMNLDPYAPVYELEDDIKDALLNYETGPYISEHIDTISAKIDSLKNNIPDELPDDFPLDRIEEDIDRIYCAVFELPFKQPLIWFNPNGIDENDPSDDNTYSFNEVGTTYKWRSLAKRKYTEGQQHIEEAKTAGYGMVGAGAVGYVAVKIGVAWLTGGFSLFAQVVGTTLLGVGITAGQFSAEAVNVRWDRLLLTTGICAMAALDMEIYRMGNLVDDTIDYVSKCLDDPSVFPSSCDVEIIDAQMQDIILAEDQTCGTTTGTITLKNMGTETAHGNILVDIVQLFGYGFQSISVTGPDEIFELSPEEVKTIEFEYSAPSNVVWQCLHEYIAVIHVSLGTNLDSTQNYPGLTENLRFYVGPEEYYGYANEESSTTVIPGETGGRSSWLESVPYTTKNNTNQVVFYLEFESGDFDLHIYDSEGNHVGFNYTTNETEVNIPNAWYSGPSSYPEIILINQSFGQTYMVEVMEVNVTGGVNFIVRAIEIPDRPALLSILPSTLNLIGKPGAIVNNSLLLSEIGGQKTAEDIELTITDLTDNASHVIPSSAVTFNLSATELPPLGGVDIPMVIEIPVDAVSGKYTGKINVTASNGIAAEITINVIVSYPPDTPSINGPTTGKAGTEYEYTFTATDPDGDDVYYYIDWGDETDKDWIGPYAPGEEVTRNHTWSEQGTYIIRAKAIDVYGAESDWGELTVTMPRNKALNFNFNLLEWLFERFPNAFPILRLRLGLQ